MPGQRQQRLVSGIAKLGVVALVVAILGLPINHLLNYALLAAAVLLVVVGDPRLDRKPWLLAGAVTLVSLLALAYLRPPLIEVGENIFLTDVNKPDTVFKRELPPEVFDFMVAQFDKTYPPDKRCGQVAGCWRNSAYPKRLFAFSADGIYDSPKFSRHVNAIDFADATWLGLGFTNELDYNWYSHTSDIWRGRRDPRPWAFFHRWHLMMPWFVMYVFPPQFAGSELCWRGDVLWEQPGGRFRHEGHSQMSCRVLQPYDSGKRIFGVSIQPESLAVTLKPTVGLKIWQTAQRLVTIGGVAALLLLLLRCPLARLKLPLFLLALALTLLLLSDASLFGGFRYHDGGDDGLVYESRGRDIVRFLMAGDFFQAFRGGADVFYFTPGFRYFRAVERLIFGETNFGYLSLMLTMPFLVWGLFRRFLPASWTLVLTLVFLLTPVGLLFGSNYFLYIQNASRGYAGAATAILLLGGMLLLIGRTVEGPDRQRFTTAFFAAFLMAIATQMRPNIAPAVGILLGGAGVAALWWGQLRRLLGLCIGFAPVFLCAVHNWYYGGKLVLFSTNATHSSVYKTHPVEYLQALYELARLQLRGDHVQQVSQMVVHLLTGPRQWLSMVPLHAVAVAVLIRVAFSRRYDPWLRLVATSAIAGLAVALFYVAWPRYLLVFWLIAFMVAAVWLRQEGLPLLRHYAPWLTRRISSHPLWQKAARSLTTGQNLIGAK